MPQCEARKAAPCRTPPQQQRRRRRRQQQQQQQQRPCLHHERRGHALPVAAQALARAPPHLLHQRLLVWRGSGGAKGTAGRVGAGLDRTARSRSEAVAFQHGASRVGCQGPCTAVQAAADPYDPPARGSCPWGRRCWVAAPRRHRIPTRRPRPARRRRPPAPPGPPAAARPRRQTAAARRAAGRRAAGWRAARRRPAAAAPPPCAAAPSPPARASPC